MPRHASAASGDTVLYDSDASDGDRRSNSVREPTKPRWNLRVMNGQVVATRDSMSHKAKLSPTSALNPTSEIVHESADLLLSASNTDGNKKIARQDENKKINARQAPSASADVSLEADDDSGGSTLFDASPGASPTSVSSSLSSDSSEDKLEAGYLSLSLSLPPSLCIYIYIYICIHIHICI